MPRDTNGIAKQPPSTRAVPLQPMKSADYNAVVDDLYNLQNEARPIAAGGTGQTDLHLPADKLGIRDAADPTKVVVFDVSPLGTGKTVVLSAPANDGAIALQADAARARLRTRAVNGAFQIAQENGYAVGTVNGYRPADNWWWYFGASGAAASVQRVQARSLNGSTEQLEHKTITAKTVLAANDNAAITTAIEGVNFADLEWGTPRAKALLVDFEMSAPAGTYSLHVSTMSANRNYATPFVVAADEAGLPIRRTVRIPGDTGGIWETGAAAAVVVDFVLAAGPSLTGATNTWGTAGTLAVAGQKNILDTAGATVRIADVGLYADNDNTGIAPKWQAPSLEETERWCLRYYWKIAGAAYVGICNGLFFNASSWTGIFTFPVTMRTAPQVAVSAQNGFETSGAAILQTTAMGVANPSNQNIRVQATVAGATAGQGAFLRFGASGGWLSFHARLLG